MDRRGHIVIPSELRKAKGFAPHTLFVIVPDGDELRLVPSEVKPRRETRMYSNEEIAQSLMDSAVTPQGIRAAHEGILELGLNPADFSPNV